MGPTGTSVLLRLVIPDSNAQPDTWYL